MDNLFHEWASKTPKYGKKFRDTLFKSKANKGSEYRDEEVIESLGKHFSTHYELYIYAFFLGLYSDEFIEIPKESKKVDFGYKIQHWGSKNNSRKNDIRFSRSSFTELQEYMFVALIAKTDIDLIALEKGEIKVEKVVKQLIHTMESYTNGGLILLEEKGEDNPNYHLDSTAFLDLIMETKQISEN
jgi:hypothetical protein